MIYLVTNQKQIFNDITPNILFAEVSDVLNYFKDKPEVEFDTETTGFDPHSCKLISAQFGDEKNQYVVDCNTVDIKLFKKLLESKLILMQNAKFDLKFLYKQDIWPNNIYDTFLAECVLSMGDKSVRKGLDALVYRYTKQHMSKEVRGVIHKEGLSTRVIEYAANDVKYLGEIKRKQEVKLKQLNLEKALRLDNKFVKVLAFVEFCGFYLDKNKWSDKMIEDNASLITSRDNLDEWIKESRPEYIDKQLDLFSDEQKINLNWNSEKQVIPIMQDLGVETKIRDKKTGKMKDSIDVKVLQSQTSKHELIPKYIGYKKLLKLTSSFGQNILDQIHTATGRIHTTYKQLMDTGRMSCGGKDRIMRTEYVNLQQIPADERHRGCFVPEEGNKLVVADYSGQESVVFANFCQDPEIIAFYTEGLSDMHSFIAQKIYPELEGLTLDEIKEQHKDKRQAAKAAGFAIQYGGVGATIANNLGLTIPEGDNIYNGYFEAFTGVKEYFEKCKKDVIDKGYVELNPVSNRKSFIDFYDNYLELKKVIKQDGFWDEYKREKAKDSDSFKNFYKPKVREFFRLQGIMERKSLNYPIQGTSAEITKLAALKFFEELVKSGMHKSVKICNIVHDEIVIECREDAADYYGSRLQHHMEEAGKPFCKIIPLKASPVVADYWTH